jgi:hypothetical protein
VGRGGNTWLKHTGHRLINKWLEIGHKRGKNDCFLVKNNDAHMLTQLGKLSIWSSNKKQKGTQ